MWTTIGHEMAVNTLKRSLQEGRLSHAYLVAGPPQVGKMTLAMDIARVVNCLAPSADTGVSGIEPCGDCNQCTRIADALHADVQVLGLDTPEAGDGRGRVAISIDQVRQLQREASLKPYEGRYRVFIFDAAERLSEEAANSLLKILEEPPDQVVLLLLTSDIAALPLTIVSRCRKLELRPLPLSQVAHELETRYQLQQDKANEIARLSGGRLGWALQALSQPDLMEHRAETLVAIEATLGGTLQQRFSYGSNVASMFMRNRQSARLELALWLQWWRDVLMIKEGVPELVTNVSRMDTLQLTAKALSSAQVAGALRAIQETSVYLERNVNAQLVLEELMLVLPRP